MYKDKSQHDPEQRTAPEPGNRRPADKRRQEGKRRAGNGIDNGGKIFPGRIHLDQRLVIEEDPGPGQNIIDPEQQTRRYDSRKNRNKNIGQRLNRPLERILLAGCRRFHLILGSAGTAGELNHLIIHFIHSSRSDHDLELPLG
ncbi:hypothetical protein D3C73_1049400 [compost metagenome]